MAHGANGYARTYRANAVLTASPGQLVLMLYDGALAALADAKRHMTNKEIAAKGQALSKAIMIIESGLKASLDIKAGGELGERLAALYEYMCDRLLRANLHNRIEIIDEVARLLVDLRGTWAQIKPASTGANDSAAGEKLLRRA